MNYLELLQARIEQTIIGLSWEEIKDIYDDDADTLTHQIYREKIYWDCAFNNNICVAVKYAFKES